jgi:outer membrane protein TolC
MVRFFLIVVLIISYVNAQAVSLETIFEQAVENSYKLKIIKNKEMIYDAKLEEASSSYYPTLSFGFNLQYTKGYEDDENEISNVGDTILSSQTRYESSSSIKLDYLLYDFGNRRNQYDIAKLDKKFVKTEFVQQYQEIKLELLDLFSKVLNIKVDIKINSKIKENYEKMYIAKKRLYNAGEIDKVSLATNAIDIVELGNKLEENELLLEEYLYQINLYTDSSYNKNTKFNFSLIPTTQRIRYEESIMYEDIRLQKQKVSKEISQVSSEYYPRVSFYGKYNLYGSAECSAYCAVDELKKRNYVVGFSVNWILFNGFQTSSKKKRLKAELEQIKLKELEEKREFVKQQKLNIKKIFSLNNNIENYQNNLNIHENKVEMNRRLRGIKKINKISEFEDMVEKLKKELELKKSFIIKWSKQKEVEILNENTFKEI